MPYRAMCSTFATSQSKTIRIDSVHTDSFRMHGACHGVDRELCATGLNTTTKQLDTRSRSVHWSTGNPITSGFPQPWPGSGRKCREADVRPSALTRPDRKSTRLNSSHLGISYAVFCL